MKARKTVVAIDEIGPREANNQLMVWKSYKALEPADELCRAFRVSLKTVDGEAQTLSRTALGVALVKAGPTNLIVEMNPQFCPDAILAASHGRKMREFAFLSLIEEAPALTRGTAAEIQQSFESIVQHAMSRKVSKTPQPWANTIVGETIAKSYRALTFDLVAGLRELDFDQFFDGDNSQTSYKTTETLQ